VIKAVFSASLVFSVTWSFRNHSNVIWCSRNISYYCQCWKQLRFIFSLWYTFFQDSWWIESSKEHCLK